MDGHVIGDGRVAPPDCSSGAPTDPDVRNSRIRLLRSSTRCAPVDTVNDTRKGKRVALQQRLEAEPGKLGAVGTTKQPLAPEPFHCMQ
jgi:hypothetical protein